MKIIEMTALRRFRLADGPALRWIEAGEKYSIPSEQKQFHTTTKRGRPVPDKKEKD